MQSRREITRPATLGKPDVPENREKPLSILNDATGATDRCSAHIDAYGPGYDLD